MTFADHRTQVAWVNALRKDSQVEPLPKLAISFSGGRTSAVMTKLIWDRHKNTHDIIITFANTGCEHEKTLDFVNKCTDEFGWPVVWVEAVIDPEKGKGVKHRVVTYETASRKGEPFEEAIKKYGIFNKVSPNCNPRLKVEPMNSLLKEFGFLRGKGLNYQTAIGIRAD